MGPGRPAKTPNPRKRAPGVSDTRKLRDEGSSPPSDRRPARGPASAEPRAPEAARRPGRRQAACGNPTRSPLEVSNASFPRRAAGVMATSGRRGPTPLVLSRPWRVLAPGTARNRAFETKRPPLSPPGASAPGSGSRSTPGAQTPKSQEPGIRSPARSLAIECRWDRKSSPRAAATSERRRSEKEASHLFSQCRSKAQGSNERRRVETPDGAADSTSGARP